MSNPALSNLRIFEPNYFHEWVNVMFVTFFEFIIVEFYLGWTTPRLVGLVVAWAAGEQEVLGSIPSSGSVCICQSGISQYHSRT